MHNLQDVEKLLTHRTAYPSIILFGAPGSGKGTVGKSLSQVANCLHLSSGDIFRGISSSSELGKFCQSYSNQGLLIPDEAVVTIWRHYVDALKATYQYKPEKQILLLDGIPRTEKQIKLIDPYVDIRGIIVLDIESEEELIVRLQKRAALEGRKDDIDVNILKKRFEVYKNETAAVLQNYPPEKIFRVNASQHPMCVLSDVLKQLSKIIL